MIGERLRDRLAGARTIDQRRAVIDIGSNTVRLVVYGGPPRAPAVLWNEKVSARLGRDLAKTGRIPDSAMEEALAGLARYAQIIDDLGIEQIEAVATAAPREASNGAQFLAIVKTLGLDVRLLSGEDEARASAEGAIGAFPGISGLVADLGGGSLELIPIADGACGAGVSLPLGTLRLPALRVGEGFGKRVSTLLDRAALPGGDARPLIMIGGTWRAFASYAMRAADHPLTDPHGYRLDPDAAQTLARIVQRSEPARLADVRGITAMRAEKLPDAAALLRVMLDRLQPSGLVFSSWGLREGLHFHRLDAATRAQDPLIEGVAAFAGEVSTGMASARQIAKWIGAVGPAEPAAARIRLAAAHLAPVLHRVEPNLRVAQGAEWALDKRWIGIEPHERAILAAMLLGSLGGADWPRRLALLATETQLAGARATGQALRLAQRLGGGAGAALAASSLGVAGNTLVLTLSAQYAVLATPSVGKDLAALAQSLSLDPELMIADHPR